MPTDFGGANNPFGGVNKPFGGVNNVGKRHACRARDTRGQHHSNVSESEEGGV